MTRRDIDRAIRTLRKEHPESPQRNHIEGLLQAAKQCVEALEVLEAS